MTLHPKYTVQWYHLSSGSLAKDTLRSPCLMVKLLYAISPLWNLNGFFYHKASPSLSPYRVIHLLWDLGWVGLEFSCSTVCPVLLGLMGIWQKRISNWARWWNTQIKVNPTQVLEQMNHPVPPLSYSRLQVSPIGYLAPPPQRWGLKAQENFSSGLMSRPDGERNIR